MTKRELIQAINKSNSNYTSGMIKGVLALLTAELLKGLNARDKITLPFGRFKIRVLQPRKAYNPIAKKMILLPERKKVVFKTSTNFQKMIK